MGIPTSMISALVPLAASVGATRIVEGRAITHPLGDPALPGPEELSFRKGIVQAALAALGREVDGQLIVPLAAAS